MQVNVRDNNVEQALRALKKKLQREGVFREMKLRQHFEKPSVKKAREQAEAVRARNVLQMIAAGGNAYYLAKLAGIFHLDMQDIGAQQTGMTKAEFQALLRSHA